MPKFHEFCHITRDILRFGPPLGTSTEANEGFLGKDKDEAIHTQRWTHNFSQQTSQRHFETDVINYSYKNLHQLICQKTSTGLSTSSNKNKNKNKQRYDDLNANINMRGKFIVNLNLEKDDIEILYPDSKSKKMIKVSNERDFGADLKNFWFDWYVKYCFTAMFYHNGTYRIIVSWLFSRFCQ